MVEVAGAHPAAQHRPLEAEGLDAPLEFQGGFIRHRHRQRRQRLESIRMSCDCQGHGIIDPSRHVDAFGSQVVERGRGEGQDLNVQSALIHEGEAFLGKVDQALLDRAGMKGNTGVRCFQADRVPGVANLGREKMLFYANQLHHSTISPGDGPAEVIEIFQAGSSLFRKQDVHKVRHAFLDAQASVRSPQFGTDPAWSHDHHSTRCP